VDIGIGERCFDCMDSNQCGDWLDHEQTLDALEEYCNQKFVEGSAPKLNVYMKVECGNE
jgi:hypothetical protein